jgi:hypothetical protein
MRSAAECLVKAAEMEWQASQCDAPSLRADLLSMAETWRYVAGQALWQDALIENAGHDIGPG